ncbi:unnamed protein product [Chironomus riparius]|uniref:Major facilitator superfamily (MFS) profile domain-containing protein n=1 Tax=Chironomus riparius TaxID=315576 RepID=A0A9N9RR01_9DIPT|nr:unnamed protein product [Chironomus riparius]
MSKVLEYSLEDAIARTKFGKFNYFMIVLSGLVLACGMMETNCINIILPIAQCELNLSNVHKGLLGSVGYIGIILSSHFWGFMADTRGRKKVIVPALMLSFLFTVISTFAKSFWFLALFRFLNGFCVCAPQTIIYAFLGEFHSTHHRSRVLIIASVMYGLFVLIMPINGIAFLNRENWKLFIPFLNLNYGAWRIFLFMCSLPSAICAIVMIFFVPESPKFKYAQGDEEGTLEILKKIFKSNTGKSANEYEVKALIKDDEFLKGSEVNSKGFFYFMWSQTVPLFKSPHLKNTATACFLQFGICVVANGFWTFFPEILNKVSLWTTDNPHGSATVCGVLDYFNRISSNSSTATNSDNPTCITKLEFSTFQNIAMLTLLYSVFWFVISIVINKTGKLVIMVIVAAVSGTSSILLMFIQVPMASIYIYLVLLLAGLNMSIVNTSTVELFPTTLRAMAVSISMMAGRIGSVAGSNFVGVSIKNFCTYTWLLPTILLFSGGLLSFTIPNINKRIK